MGNLGIVLVKLGLHYSCYVEDGFNKNEAGRNSGRRRPLQNPRQAFMKICPKVMTIKMGRRKWV